MRVTFMALIALLASVASDTARADPYRWCAIYGGGDDGGGTNCYFVTQQQCQWAISGNGGFCAPNQFHDSRSAVTREDSAQRTKKKSPRHN